MNRELESEPVDVELYEARREPSLAMWPVMNARSEWGRVCKSNNILMLLMCWTMGWPRRPLPSTYFPSHLSSPLLSLPIASFNTYPHKPIYPSTPYTHFLLIPTAHLLTPKLTVSSFLTFHAYHHLFNTPLTHFSYYIPIIHATHEQGH